MIVKILGSASSSFQGVQYNDKKRENGSGELMLMKNFPSFINENSSQKEVRNYLKSISKSERVNKPQFHAVISTKFQEHNKDELTKVAELFMQEMGYGAQPLIVFFHNDTDNNHVHLVSTRVDKNSGKKINDSFERLKAQKALAKVMEKLYAHDQTGELQRLLNYRISSLSQLETLLERSGFKLNANTLKDHFHDVLKNGVVQCSFSKSELSFKSSQNDARKMQIRAILNKYKDLYSNKVFRVVDNRKKHSVLPNDKLAFCQTNFKAKTEFESELQKKLRDVFGIDIIFHQKEEFKPFGYTLIDHKTQTIYKGSEIVKMNGLFQFTTDSLDKKVYEILKDYNVPDQETKQILMKFLREFYLENDIRDYMLFENRGRKDLKTYRTVQSEVKNFIRNAKDIHVDNRNIFITKGQDEKFYAVHTRNHYIGDLQSLIGEKEYLKFLNPHSLNEFKRADTNGEKELNSAVTAMIFEWSKNSGIHKDPAENELKKKRKKRR